MPSSAKATTITASGESSGVGLPSGYMSEAPAVPAIG